MVRRALTLSVASFLALVWPATTLAAAQTPSLETLTASPSVIRAEAKAGGSYAGQIKLLDTGNTSYDLIVYATPYSVSGENYDQSFVLQPKMVDASKWFHFNQTSYHMAPHTTVLVPYQIQIPAGVGSGGYYAVVFAQTSQAGGGTIKAQKRLGILQYITVSGNLNRSGRIESFAVPFLQTTSPLQTTLRLRNDGNVHYDAATEVLVKDLFGNTKAILSDNHTVLPSTIRRMSINWDKSPGFGLFRVEGTVDINGKTDQLPVRYTLLLSQTAFIIIFLCLVALVAYAVLSLRRRGNVGKR